MKVSDIITRVRNIAGDTQQIQFSDASVVDWINDGVRECAIANNLLQKRATQASVANQGDYDLPPDLLKLHSVKYNQGKLRILTLEEFDAQANEGSFTGTPQLAYIWAGKLTLYPAPDSSYPLSIDYIYDPAQVSVDALDVDPPLPVGYHARLVDYCLAQVAQQDDDMNRYAVKMQEFQTGTMNLKDLPEYENDLYPSISVSTRDMGDGYYG